MRPHKHSAVFITMKSLMLSFQWFPIILLIFSGSVTATWINIPRLSPFRQTNLKQPETMKASLSKDLQTFYYTQTLDHFNYRPESYTTFQQRYYINFKNWGGANVSAPIVAFLGAESPLGVNEIALAGFLTDNANRFNALLVYIEHRYYGKSIPFGSRKEALRNASTLGYFNSAQAIADYASILLHIKKKLHARYSPVIVIGGSYGGMLATWLRLKYPHVALGALASSAPILYFDDITPEDGYFSVVTKDFREASETCYQTVLKSWSEIDRIASKPNGLSILSKRFKTCYPLENASDLKGYLVNIYVNAAQYDQPPEYPVTKICGAIDGASSGMDILSKISAGVIAYMKNMSCYFINHELGDPSETAEGWQWQTCSEIVMPLGGKKASGAMFQTAPFNLSHIINRCKSLYGVQPRPHWVTTNYGGHDIKLILQRFASNIIFSNGLRDPYSSGGVLEDISDSVLAITTVNGSHCLDLHHAKQTDPQWLVRQRNIEIEIIEGWITKYYADLHALKQ